MRNFRFSAALLAAAVIAAAAQDAPRSILPDEAPEPPVKRAAEPRPGAEPSPAGPAPQPGEAPTSILPPTLEPAPPTATIAPPPPLFGTGLEPPAPVQGGLVQNPPPDPLALPAGASADLMRNGVLTPRGGGYGAATFAGSNGLFLAMLMDRIGPPPASRWAGIVAARAIASVSDTPRGVRPGDWTAARARVLLRMGHVMLAKRLVEPVAVDRYTPALYAAALETNLAAGDLAANCPIALTGQTLSPSPVWRLSAAMCSAFEGDDLSAARAFDALRETKDLSPLDVSLAEFVASRLGGARSASLAWEEVDRLNLYRVGVAAAAGLDMPEDLLQRASPAMLAWTFRAPGVADGARAAAAPAAATAGVLGSREFMEFYAAVADRPEAVGVGGETPARLRVAYAGGASDRVEALQALWADEALGQYPAYVLTAEAAMRLRPAERFASAAPDLMRAAQAGGRLDRAMLWWPVAEAAGGEVEQRAWPQAVVAGPQVDASAGRFRDWLEAERSRVGAERAEARGRLLLAALIGLGRADGGYDAIAAELRLRAVNTAWARRIDAAAAGGRRGEVAVLAAAGLQTASWLGVPPGHLRHIVAAYRRVGLSAEAALVAAEALSRV